MMHVMTIIFGILLWINSNIAVAVTPRNGTYDNGGHEALNIDGSTYTHFVLDSSMNVISNDSGSVTSLSVLNACQVQLNNVLFTEQACSIAYDDSSNAIRPDMTVIIPRVTVGSVEYKVVASVVTQKERIGLQILSLTPTTNRDAESVYFNTASMTIPYIRFFYPTERDCHQTFTASIQYDSATSMLWVTSLNLSGQYDFCESSRYSMSVSGSGLAK